MKKLVATMSMTVIIAIITFAAGAFSPTATYAQSDETQSDQNDEGDTTETETETAKDYEYIAQAGDSYTKLARKAVQTYGIETSTEIGGAGVLFAETNLTSIAGWPALNEGQAVLISRESIKEWVEKAAKLSAEEKANWSYYMPFVDFNTNSVGEAPKN